MSLEILPFVLGPFGTNGYLLCADADCWIVDPGPGPEPMIRRVHQAGVQPSRILLTHGHGDHIGGVTAIRAAFPSARLCCPDGDLEMLADPMLNLSGVFGITITAEPPDEIVQPGQVLHLGPYEWQVLDTSGHTPGGVSYYCPQAGAVLVGDALFAGSVGRTDIPGASTSRLLRNIRQKLLSLPDETRVLPGHGPESTVGEERATNPFLAG